jgi:hypothetical protein
MMLFCAKWESMPKQSIYSGRYKKAVMGGAGRYSLRAATPPTGGVNAPNDVKHGKAGTEVTPVGEAFLGGCPGRL